MEIGPLIIIMIGGLCALYMLLDTVKDIFAKRRKQPAAEVREAVCQAMDGATHQAGGNEGNAVRADDNEEGSEEEAEQEREMASAETRQVMTEMLDHIGSQYKDGHEGELIVKYQGETFVMSFGGRLVRIWDYGWHSIGVNDPNLPVLRQAINNCNFHTGNSMVLGMDPDHKNLWVHTVDTIMLHPSCPDNEDYVKSVLDNFFSTKHHLARLYQEMLGVHKEKGEEEISDLSSSFTPPSPN